MNAELHYVSGQWRDFAFVLGAVVYGFFLFLRPKATGRERFRKFRGIALMVCGIGLLILLIHGFLYPRPV